MGFKQDFDKIVKDLVGENIELEEYVFDDCINKETPSIDYEKYFREKYLSKMIKELDRKTTDLYKKYEEPNNFEHFIKWYSSKEIYKCSYCYKNFIIRFIPKRQRHLRYEDATNWDPFERAFHLERKMYCCMFCGRPFEIVNGDIIEIRPADFEDIIENNIGRLK